MKPKALRVRKNFTLKPVSIKMLERLSRDMDLPMSRVLEAALDSLADKRAADAESARVREIEKKFGAPT